MNPHVKSVVVADCRPSLPIVAAITFTTHDAFLRAPLVTTASGATLGRSGYNTETLTAYYRSDCDGSHAVEVQRETIAGMLRSLVEVSV